MKLSVISLTAVISALVGLSSATPLAHPLVPVSLSPSSSSTSPARRAIKDIQAHAKVYYPPSGHGGEIYLDVASTALRGVEKATCHAALTIPWKTTQCVCATDKLSNPFVNYVICDVTIVPAPRLAGNPASVTVRFTGHYFFIMNKMTLTPHTKPRACSPNCNGVRVTV